MSHLGLTRDGTGFAEFIGLIVKHTPQLVARLRAPHNKKQGYAIRGRLRAQTITMTDSKKNQLPASIEEVIPDYPQIAQSIHRYVPWHTFEDPAGKLSEPIIGAIR